MLASSVNWTEVLIVGVPGYIAAIFAGVATLIGAANRRAIRTPSGDRIGEVAERTHDLAAVGVAAVTGTNGPAVTKALAKLNADPKAPIDVPSNALEHKK